MGRKHTTHKEMKDIFRQMISSSHNTFINLLHSNTKGENMPVNIYYASSFFDAGGFMKSAKVVEAIRDRFGDKVNVYLPQENGNINDKSDTLKLVTDKDIANGDNYYLEQADILIADLDGVEPDSGVSAEIGYIAGRNSLIDELGVDKQPTHIIGFNTDMRINPTESSIVELVAGLKNDNMEQALYIIDNLKDNHLYRNLYTRGLVSLWGEYIVSPDKYILQIIQSIEKYIDNRNVMNI